MGLVFSYATALRPGLRLVSYVRGQARNREAVIALEPPARRQSASVDRSWRREAWRETRPKRELAMAVGWAGGSYTVCVRACDGSFFPVSYFGNANRSDTLEQVC